MCFRIDIDIYLVISSLLSRKYKVEESIVTSITYAQVHFHFW